MKRLISLLLCFGIILSLGCVTVSASNEVITPRFNNVMNTEADFNIDSNGNAIVSVGYYGYNGITTGAKITILLEEKRFFFFWADVEEWVITSSNYNDNFVRSCLVSEGDYRVTVTFEISGTGGATDVREVELEDSY